MSITNTSSNACPYHVGAPRDWLAAAGLANNRKACAVPLGLNCGLNAKALDDCCVQASRQALTNDSVSYTGGSVSVCALPTTVSNNTYQEFQNCILNYPGRDGGFRCNPLADSYVSDDFNSVCNNINVTISPPVKPATGYQVCSVGAYANTTKILQDCCVNGTYPQSFDGGCFQYCVGPARNDIGFCILSGFRANNISSNGLVGCTPAQNAASSISSPGIGPTLGLLAVLAWVIGL